MDGGAWKAAVHGVTKSRKRLSDFTFTFTFMHWRRKWQPLQCSCLENPRDGWAWWAAVYGVAQSQTWLKRLSSSSSSLKDSQLFSFERVDYFGDTDVLLAMKGKLFQYEFVSSGWGDVKAQPSSGKLVIWFISDKGSGSRNTRGQISALSE